MPIIFSQIPSVSDIICSNHKLVKLSELGNHINSLTFLTI